MFPEPLRNIMSLEADKPRLTFSLIFEVSEEGVINYDSLELKESMVRVTENIKHGEPISVKDDRELVSSLLVALRKCR